MNFYVPLFGDDSRLLWNVVHNDLFDRYRFASLRRIQALLWQGDARDDRSVIVGADFPGGPEGDPVLVIHESDAFPYMMFVCTLGMFRRKEAPIALALTKGWQVVYFDEDQPTRKKQIEPRRTGRRAP
ncbi:MAG TPA: hypothetical protein VGO55_08800 [Allosphingosinicella sp.]|jgi:hypothetical protein|nr:hypothetical protein [Allosphingosinicella sp.]